MVYTSLRKVFPNFREFPPRIVYKENLKFSFGKKKLKGCEKNLVLFILFSFFMKKLFFPLVVLENQKKILEMILIFHLFQF